MKLKTLINKRDYLFKEITKLEASIARYKKGFLNEDEVGLDPYKIAHNLSNISLPNRKKELDKICAKIESLKTAHGEH